MLINKIKSKPQFIYIINNTPTLIIELAAMNFLNELLIIFNDIPWYIVTKHIINNTNEQISLMLMLYRYGKMYKPNRLKYIYLFNTNNTMLLSNDIPSTKPTIDIFAGNSPILLTIASNNKIIDIHIVVSVL